MKKDSLVKWNKVNGSYEQLPSLRAKLKMSIH